EILDGIGSAAKRWLKCSFTDIALLAARVATLPPFSGQNGELANDSRQFAIAGRVRGECNLTIAGLFRFGDMAVIGRKLWVIFFERIERKNCVIRRDWRTVMPFCLLP